MRLLPLQPLAEMPREGFAALLCAMDPEWPRAVRQNVTPGHLRVGSSCRFTTASSPSRQSPVYAWRIIDAPDQVACTRHPLARVYASYRDLIDPRVRAGVHIGITLHDAWRNRD